MKRFILLDAGGSGDRYTLLDTEPDNGFHSYISFDGNPFSPMGFGQHGEMSHHAFEEHRRERFRSLGKAIKLEALPAQAQRFAKSFMDEALAANGGDGLEAVSTRTRKGTRVRFAASKGSLVLYTHHPDIGEEGSVTTMPGFGQRTHLPGPGGGLLYVKWDRSGTIGVSPNDVEKVGSLRTGPGRKGQTFERDDVVIETTLHPVIGFDGVGSLHERIAAVLDWSMRDVQSMSLPSLRELVRPVDPALADEISQTIQSGSHITRKGR